MEEEFKKLSLVNCLDKVLNMPYGSTNVVYMDDKAREETGLIIETINNIAGLQVIEERPFIDNIPTADGWESKEIPGKYTIIYSDRHNPIPSVTQDDLSVWNIIQEVSFRKTIQRIKINNALHKKVRKKCLESGVKFSLDYGFVVIDGREKSLSVYRQIQKAHSEGKKEISFNLKEINMPTVRTYASQFGSAIDEKIRCTVADGFITVIFYRGPLDDFKDAVIKATEFLSQEDILNIVKSVFTPENDFHRPEFTEVLSEELKRPEAAVLLVWEEMGFDSESEYTAYQDKKKADLADWEQTAQPKTATGSDNEPTNSTAEDSDLPPNVEIVEGLPQYVMQIPEKTDGIEDADF